jgi:hypothetical protein
VTSTITTSDARRFANSLNTALHLLIAALIARSRLGFERLHAIHDRFVRHSPSAAYFVTAKLAAADQIV